MGIKEEAIALDTLEKEVGKTYRDLRYFLLALNEILIENGEEEVARSIPWIHSGPAEISLPVSKLVQLYSLIFQLVNMVEINHAVQQRRAMEDTDLTRVNGLWAQNIKELKDSGFTVEEILTELKAIDIEPVLTAHPTEAKRATVLEHHRELYLLLVQLENSMYSKQEQENIRTNIKQALFRLWKTGEISLEKPTQPNCFGP